MQTRAPKYRAILFALVIITFFSFLPQAFALDVSENVSQTEDYADASGAKTLTGVTDDSAAEINFTGTSINLSVTRSATTESTSTFNATTNIYGLYAKAGSVNATSAAIIISANINIKKTVGGMINGYGNFYGITASNNAQGSIVTLKDISVITESVGSNTRAQDNAVGIYATNGKATATGTVTLENIKYQTTTVKTADYGLVGYGQGNFYGLYGGTGVEANEVILKNLARIVLVTAKDSATATAANTGNSTTAGIFVKSGSATANGNILLDGIELRAEAVNDGIETASASAFGDIYGIYAGKLNNQNANVSAKEITLKSYPLRLQYRIRHRHRAFYGTGKWRCSRSLRR